MTTGRYVLVTAVGLSLAAVCLVLAKPGLAVAGTGFVVLVLVARGVWMWSGASWAVRMVGLLAAVVAVAFVLQRLIG